MRILRQFLFTEAGLSVVRIRRKEWAAGILLLIVSAFILLPFPMYDKLWAVAFGICPQRPGHSLFFGNVQMPIEAREGGMFAGFLLGIMYLIVLGRGTARELPPRKILVLLVGFVVLMGLDGLNAAAYDLYLPTLYAPNLYLRWGTGLLTGLALTGIMVPIFNQSTWRWSKPVASFSDWREMGFALILWALFWALGLSGWKPLLYPISVLAIGGQLALMVSIGAMIAATLLRPERQVRDFTELAPLLLIGLVFVLILLGTTSAVRYTLFGPGSLPALR